ncbi:MAG TPA: transposase [Salinivirgaceae bacterium]|nr:transposase [Salinivirgaceae bacterium]
MIHSSLNAYFHIVNHSVDGRKLYYDPGDYKTYLYLFKKELDYKVTVIAYCLMPNHFHLLLRQNESEAITSLLEKTHKKYACYYNKKYDRKGRIFRSPLNHIETPTDTYLLNACAYIHGNPVQAGLVGFPEEWEYSNFREYLRMRKGTLYSEQFLMDYIGNPEFYRLNVIDIARKKSMQRAFEKDSILF